MSAVEVSVNYQPAGGSGYLKMDSIFDARAFERRNCDALMEFSYFNQSKSYDAKVLNCSPGGICFQSSRYLQPGATVCIRVKEFQCSDSPEDTADDLYCMSLAEVKWCNELPGTESAAYSVGVKYQAPTY
jgi:hypothetical protein